MQIKHALSWTNQSFIDLTIEHDGIEYYWQATMDGKLSTWQIRDMDHDEDLDSTTSLYMKIDKKAYDYLDTKDIHTGKSKLSELLDNIYYEG